MGLTTFVLLMLSSVYAQEKKTFQTTTSTSFYSKPLESEGNTIPDPFFYTAEDWHIRGQKVLSLKTGKDNKLQQSRFLIISAKNTADVFQSGKVLFGDVLSLHLQKVVDKLLEKESGLKKKMTFYVIKGEGLAIQYDMFGNVFVPVALFAQIENDAQLAFMLGASIAMYESNASFEMFKEIAEKVNSSNIHSAFNFEKMDAYEVDYKLSANNLQRAIELIHNAKFNTEEAIYALDMMYHKTAAVEDLPFNFAYFNSKGYSLHVPANIDSFYRPFEGIPVKDEMSEENDDYTLLKNKYIGYVSGLSEDKGDILYVESKEQTKSIKMAAWFECIRKQLVIGAYQKAFYNAYCLLPLLKENTADYFAVKEMMGKALYLYGLNKQFIEVEYAGLLCIPTFFHPIVKKSVTKINLVNSKEDSKSNGEKTIVNKSLYEKKYVGEFNKVYYLLNTMPSAELLLLGTRILWEVYEQDNTNERLFHYANKSLHLTSEYFYRNNLQFSFELYREGVIDSAKIANEKRRVEIEEKLKETKLDKYEKLSLQRELNTLNMPTKIGGGEYATIFDNLLTHSKSFKQAIEEQKNQHKKWDDNKEERTNLSVKELANIERRKENEIEEINRKGFSLGIDKIVLLSPEQNKVSAKNKDKHFDKNLRELLNNNNKNKFISNIEAASKSNKVGTETLYSASISSNDINKYNDLLLLSEIIEEITNLYIYQNRKNVFITENYNSESYRASQLSNRINSNFFALHFLDEVSYVNREKRATNLLLSFFMYPLAPYFIASALGMDYETTTTSILVDITTGKVVLGEASKSNHRAINAVQRQHLFTFYKQIKRSPK